MNLTLLRYKVNWMFVIPLIFAAKVFVFAAAYPLFNTTDELPNFDTVVKQGRGYSYADTLFTYDSLTLRIAHEFQSENYVLGDKQNPEFVPLLNLQYRTEWPIYYDIFSTISHQQAHSSPIYYRSYGFVFSVLPDSLSYLSKVYFLRFLNAILAFALAWVVMSFMTQIANKPRWGIASGILLIGIPQSIFYFINIDILSALTCSFSFLSATWVIKQKSIGYSMLFGVGCAIALLVKASALVAIASCFLFIFSALKTDLKTKWLLLCTSGGLFVLTITPAVIQRLNADAGLFATKAKIEVLGWEEKSVDQYFPHVLQSWGAIREYGLQTWKTWWTGESLWNGTKIYDGFWKDYYGYLTIMILGVAFLIMLVSTRQRTLRQFMRYTSMICMVGYFLLFAYLSIKYDFGDCVYPSKFFPVFVSGRLMLGMLVPFLFLFIDTIDGLLPNRNKLLVLVILAFSISNLAIEIVVTHDVFLDPKNFYNKVLIP